MHTFRLHLRAPIQRTDQKPYDDHSDISKCSRDLLRAVGQKQAEAGQRRLELHHAVLGIFILAYIIIGSSAGFIGATDLDGAGWTGQVARSSTSTSRAAAAVKDGEEKQEDGRK